MIKVEDLHKSFDGLPVLRGASFEVAKGEILALIGGSGQGKSVILKHVVGLIRPDRGRIYIEGKDLSGLRGSELERLRSRIGFLFQSGALFSSLTVFDNVAFPLRERNKLSHREIKETVLTVLDQVGLRGAEDKYPAQISGGMIKRTALARAVVRSPEIMLFDEPTTGLDPIIAHTILDLIKSVHKELRFTGIIVSHELSRLFQITQRVAMLHQGRIQIAGTPKEIMTSSDPIVQQFVSESIAAPIRSYGAGGT